MKDRDKIDWVKVGELISQHDTCLRAVNELRVLDNSEAESALEDIRQEIIDEIDGTDTKVG